MKIFIVKQINVLLHYYTLKFGSVETKKLSKFSILKEIFENL